MTETLVDTWVPTDEAFAARLAMVRHRMGWNIKEAARECGQPAATWRLWEIDGTLPRDIVGVAKVVSARTGCSFRWLLLGPDESALTAKYSRPSGRPHRRRRSAHVRRRRQVSTRPSGRAQSGTIAPQPARPRMLPRSRTPLRSVAP